MKLNRMAAVGTIILVGAAVFIALLVLGARGHPPVDHSTSITASNGLELSLIANATTISYGGHAKLDVDIINKMGNTNRVALGNDWPAQNLSLSPCGREFFPYGVAIFSGMYGKTNLSLGHSIPIFTPSNSNSSAFDCPNSYYTTPLYYVFQPDSDIALVHYQVGPNATLGMNITLIVGNYLDNSGVERPFGPGTYTIICGDSWGDLVFIYLAVLPRTTTT